MRQVAGAGIVGLGAEDLIAEAVLAIEPGEQPGRQKVGLDQSLLFR